MYADTTYNLGDFYVTLLSYKHLMLEDIHTGKPPVLPGPVLVYQQMCFPYLTTLLLLSLMLINSFKYFASSPIDADKSLRYVLAFRTDGDTQSQRCP